MKYEKHGDKIRTEVRDSTVSNSNLGKAERFAWTKTIQQTGDAGVKHEMEKLAELVEAFVKTGPAEAAVKAQDHLEVLAKQAAKTKPDRSLFECSTKGLLEAFSAVASVAEKGIPLLERLKMHFGL
jgi:hypothetical protein